MSLDGPAVAKMWDYAILNPLKDPAEIFVLNKEDKSLLAKFHSQMPIHLKIPMIRVLLVALTYIALALCLVFGIFLLRKDAKIRIENHLKEIKQGEEKVNKTKNATYEFYLSKLRNPTPLSSAPLVKDASVGCNFIDDDNSASPPTTDGESDDDWGSVPESDDESDDDWSSVPDSNDESDDESDDIPPSIRS